jgi:hypothetical protein
MIFTAFMIMIYSTPSIHERMQFLFFEESTDLKFDQNYIKIH